jgi:hypothetical protein
MIGSGYGHAVRAALLTLSVVALAGCGSTTIDGPATAAVLPDRDGGPEAANSGVLRGDPDSGCLWLEGPNGQREQVMLVGDFHVDWTPEPARVELGGEPWADLGEFLNVGGGGEANEGVAGCPVETSGGHLFLIFSRFTPPPTE